MSNAPTHGEDNPIIDRPDEYLETQWLPREEIEPNDWNPNEIEDTERDMLHRSIMNHGWTRPIVIHAEEHYIIDGEQRWTVAEDDEIQADEDLTPEGVPAGYVPVFGITLDEEQAKVSTIQHNRARGFVSYNNLYDYLDIFNEENLLDELRDELDFDKDGMLRIVDDEGVAEAIHKGGHELNPPWEPRDIREFDDTEIEASTRTSGLQDSADGMDSDDPEASPSAERVTAVLSDDELDKVNGVFSEDQTADAVMAYIHYLDQNDMIDAFRDTVDIQLDEEHPHPDEIAAEAENEDSE